MRKIAVIIISLCIFPILGIAQKKYNSITANSVCIQDICLLDSTYKLFKKFGQPELIFIDEPCKGENCEPQLRNYKYYNSYFMEMINIKNYNDLLCGFILSDSFFNIDINDTISIKIGDTLNIEYLGKLFPESCETMMSEYQSSIELNADIQSKYLKLNLSDGREDFFFYINSILFVFSKNILTKIEVIYTAQ
jgi:hypothetical protein